MAIRITFEGNAGEKNLNSLADWLRNEPNIRQHAKITMESAPPRPGRLGVPFEAIQLAVERDRARRENDAAIAGLRISYGTLTPRESEVMLLVATGRLNKQIANDLGLTEATVKVHRGQAMRKMQARSVADLVRMSDKLGLSTETAPKTSVKQN